jgi:predicted nucleotidyltransferase
MVEFNNMSYDFYAENYNEFENSLTSLLNRELDLISPKFLRNRIFIKRLNETKKKIFES